MLGVPPYWMVARFTTFFSSCKVSSILSGWRQKGAGILRSCFLLPLLLLMLLLCFHQCGRQTVTPLVSTAEDRRFLTGLGGGCVATYFKTLKVIVGSHICRRERCLPLRHRKVMGDPARRPSLRQRVGRSRWCFFLPGGWGKVSQAFSVSGVGRLFDTRYAPSPFAHALSNVHPGVVALAIKNSVM